jgi:hypothetical protein
VQKGAIVEKCHVHFARARREGDEIAGTQVDITEPIMVTRIVAASLFVCSALAGCELEPPKPPSAETVCATGSIAECEAVCKAGDKGGCDAFGARICKEGSTLECQAACDTDNIPACKALAQMYWLGGRVKADEPTYYAISAKICRLGDTDECRKLAHHYIDDPEGGAQAKTLAAGYFKDLCVETELYNSSDAIKRECKGPSSSARAACAERERARANQVEEDCTLLAMLDPVGIDIFVRACDRGEIGACGVLTDRLKTQIEKDRPAVYLEALRKLCHLASTQGNHSSDACGRLKDAALPHG